MRIRHTISNSLLLLVAGTMLSAISLGGPVDSSVPKEAADAIQAADWAKVSAILRLLAGSDKATEPVHYWYAVAMYNQEKSTSDDTIGHIQAALKANPASLATAQLLARAAVKMPVHEKAAETIQPALAAFGDDPVIGRCAAKIEMGFYWSTYKGPYRDVTDAAMHLRKARDYLDKAIAVDPSDCQSHLDLVEVFNQTGEYQQAIEHLLMADRLQPLGSEVYVMLAQIYAKTGDHDAAADAYQTAIELAPAKSGQIEWDLGMSLMEAGRSQEALDVFGKVWKRNNMSTKVRLMFGRAAYDCGDYPRALFAFKQAYTVDHNLDALVWSGRCAYDMGQDDGAIELVNRAIEEGKKRAGQGKEFEIDPLWHFVRGRALWQSNQKEKALDDLEAAALGDPSNADYAKWAIYAFHQFNDPYGVVRVARAYGMADDPAQAMEVLRAVRQMWVLFPPRADHRGKTYRGGITGQTGMAFAQLYDKQGYTRTAASLASSAGYNSKGVVNSWSCWLTYRGGDAQEADRMFDVLARNGKADIYKQQGFRGLAFTALLRRDGASARKNAQAVTTEGYDQIRTTVLKWADVFDKKPGAVDKLDSFDLLGVYGTSLNGAGFHRGLSVLGLLPDCPLAGADPPVEPGDVIIRVGDRYLTAWDSIGRLRQQPASKGPTPVLVRRKDREFEVTVDFEAARKAIAGPAPTDTEVIPR